MFKDGAQRRYQGFAGSYLIAYDEITCIREGWQDGGHSGQVIGVDDALLHIRGMPSEDVQERAAKPKLPNEGMYQGLDVSPHGP